MSKTRAEINIFVAYALADEKLLAELVKFLSVLRVKIWHTGEILPSQNVELETTTQLAKADIILSLLSADFLSMGFDETIQRHKKEDAFVIPVVLRYCTWSETYFSKFAALPQDRKPVTRLLGEESAQQSQDKYFNEVTEALQLLVDQMIAPNFRADDCGHFSTPQTVAPRPQLRYDPDRVLSGEKLYLLCDRYSQSTNFSSELPVIVQDAAKKPKCFVLIGDYLEQHSSLIERFTHQYLHPLFKDKKTPVGNLVVPKYLMESIEVGKMNIRRKLAEMVMPAKGHQITASDILDAKAGYEVLLIQHNIMSSDWNSATNDLIKWYLQEFWNVPALKHHPIVFIFLNIVHSSQQENKGILAGLFKRTFNPMKQLEELSKELRINYYLLDELKPVHPDDVRQWFLDHAHDLELDETGIMGELYEIPKASRQSMKKVEQTLKSAIEKTLKL